MLETIAIERYEQFLLGRNRIALNGTPADKERAAKAIIHYAVTELLGWDERETEEHMTMTQLRALKLDQLFKYIRFPADIEPEDDLDYIACLAFPQHEYNVEKQIKRVYRRILHGELERFPKKIFEGNKGKEKGAVLLNEFVARNIVVKSMDYLYELFSDMPRMNDRFRRAKIYSAARKLYPTPLDFLHNSLAEGDKDDFLYAFWQYMTVCKIAENELKKLDAGKKIREHGEPESERNLGTSSDILLSEKSELEERPNNEMAEGTEEKELEEIEQENQSAELQTEPAPKRKRGRPRKNPADKKDFRIFQAYCKQGEKVRLIVKRKTSF